MAEEAKAAIGTAVVELEAALPLDVMLVAVDQLTAPQALGRVALSGLYQLCRIVEQPLDIADTSLESLKRQRLVGDMALGANKLLKSHAEGERNHDLIGRLLAALEAEKVAPEKE